MHVYILKCVDVLVTPEQLLRINSLVLGTRNGVKDIFVGFQLSLSIQLFSVYKLFIIYLFNFVIFILLLFYIYDFGFVCQVIKL